MTILYYFDRTCKKNIFATLTKKQIQKMYRSIGIDARYSGKRKEFLLYSFKFDV